MFEFYIYGDYREDITCLVNDIDSKIILTLAERDKADIADLSRVVSISIRELSERIRNLERIGILKHRVHDGVSYYSLRVPILTLDELDSLLAIIENALRVWIVKFKTVKLSDIKDLKRKLLISRFSDENLEFIILSKILMEHFVDYFTNRGIFGNMVSTEFGKYYLFAIESGRLSLAEIPIWIRKINIKDYIISSAGIKNKPLSLPDYKNVNLIMEEIARLLGILDELIEFGGEMPIKKVDAPLSLLALLEITGYIKIDGEKMKLAVPLISSADARSIEGLAKSFIKTLDKDINELFAEAHKFYNKSKLKMIGIKEEEYNVMFWFLFTGKLLERLIEECHIMLEDSVSGKRYAKWIEMKK